MKTLADLRSHPRYPLTAPIQVSWQDARGVEWNDEGSCLEISVGGIKMELPHPVPIHTSVTLQMPDPRFNDLASVCHSTVVGSRYRIGVALQSPPSEALQATVAVEARRRQQREQDVGLRSWPTLVEPADDAVRTFFQDVRVRQSQRAASMEVRHRLLLGLVVVVWVAIGALLILNRPWLLRVAAASYRHPLVQKAADFVKTLMNRNVEKR